MAKTHEVKVTRNPREAKRLQEQGWELTGIDRNLTTPNRFHLRRPIEQTSTQTSVLDTQVVRYEVQKIVKKIEKLEKKEKPGWIARLRLYGLENQLELAHEKLRKL